MKSKAIQISQLGATVIIPGLAGQVVRVFAFSLSAVPISDDLQAPVWGLVKWQSLTPVSLAATDLTGFRKVDQLGMVWDMPMCPMRLTRPDAYFETLQGDSLVLFQETAFDLGGFLDYEQVPI